MLRHETGATVDFEEKALKEDSDCWTITGYGSVFNNVDLGNDVVVPGAFAKSLRENGLPLLLLNHKMDDVPIGTIIDAKEDKRGLWFKAELPKDDALVRDRIVPQLKRRGLKGTSIGYKATQKERRKEDGARLLKEIRLYEISVVTMPMNPLASIDSCKGAVPFADLPVARDQKSWDAAAALARIKAKFGDSPEVRQAFLFADDEKGIDQWDARLLIADVDEKTSRLVANPVALFKASAALCGARGGVDLSEQAVEVVQDHLDRYYASLSMESPRKSLSVEEFDALDLGEREARLRGIGLSRKLAARLSTSGQRDVGRDQPQRDAAAPEDAVKLLSALSEALSSVVARKSG